MIRRTLADETPRIEGVGLHTGAPSWVRLLPSDAPGGILFRSADSGSEAYATAQSVVDTRRCTVIEIAARRFSTVEHLMSALAGCGVTDAVVEFDGPESPILDGSALPFVRHIEATGIREMGAVVEPISVAELMVIDGANGERLIVVPSDSFSVTVVLEYADYPAIGVQAARYSGVGGDYAGQVAPARTYGFLSEFEQIRSQGLASGASLANCIALLDDGSADSRTPMRFPNELARHKLLDVMGDLALAGRPLRADIVALRPSHAVNCSLARELAAL